MSAETLRKAAALVRGRAEGATPGPWTCYGDHLVWPSEQGPAANDPILATMGEAHQGSAEHIASWHPAVALAVADWLDERADAEERWSRAGNGHPRIVPREFTVAHNVARTYLGADA